MQHSHKKMDHYSINDIREAADFLRSQGITQPVIGIILGTGLDAMTDHIQPLCAIAYGSIPHFPVSTVDFHKGQLIYGMLGNKYVLAMQGRFHLYEGYSLQRITFPIRVMKVLGINTLLVSNASGSMNPSMKKGELMVLEDHINLQPGSPLAGPNLDELGTRFPDMSEPYSPDLRKRLHAIASARGILLHEGVYVAVAGPQFETRAEYRYRRAMGADAVGMSTVPEVIVARHMGMEVAAVSAITDECDPDKLVPLSLEDILAAAARAEKDLTLLFNDLILSM